MVSNANSHMERMSFVQFLGIPSTRQRYAKPFIPLVLVHMVFVAALSIQRALNLRHSSSRVLLQLLLHPLLLLLLPFPLHHHHQQWFPPNGQLHGPLVYPRRKVMMMMFLILLQLLPRSVLPSSELFASESILLSSKLFYFNTLFNNTFHNNWTLIYFYELNIGHALSRTLTILTPCRLRSDVCGILFIPHYT